jgi:hypothetical protein
MMDRFLEMLPEAAGAGSGAILCLLGFRHFRFLALTGGVLALAAAGFAIGGLAGHPVAAAGLCAIGACAGYRLESVFFYVYVALLAALGGAAIGFVAAVAAHCASWKLVCGATAVGCAAIALMNARPITIAWTSAAGSALVCLGALGVFPATGSSTLAALFAVLFAGSAVFQHCSTRVPAPSAPLLPRPAPLRAS